MVNSLPKGVGLAEAARAAGVLGRFNAIDLHFDPVSRYTLWSGLIGGFFLQLSYFGTDQSQVGRYLTASSVAQSRLGLVFNGLAKIPMQFGILLLGVMVFVFHLFVLPPLYFNPAEAERLAYGPHSADYRALEARHQEAFGARMGAIETMLESERAGDRARARAAAEEARAAQARVQSVRAEAVELLGLRLLAIDDARGQPNQLRQTNVLAE